MTSQEDERAWKQRIKYKVRSRTSAFNVSFSKAHPVSGQLHPEYPVGNFIQLTFASPYRYSQTPPHFFLNEAELDHFLRTFT